MWKPRKRESICVLVEGSFSNEFIHVYNNDNYMSKRSFVSFWLEGFCG